MNRHSIPRPTIEWLLRLACALTFIGHGWICFNGQMPLRALLWNEELMTGVVFQLTGIDWSSWVTSLEVDDGINTAVRIQGIIFCCFAATSLMPIRQALFRTVYLFGFLNLIFVTWLRYLDHGIGIGNFFEHTAQFLLPLVLFFVTRKGNFSLVTRFTAKVSIAFTFICHGLFAINFRSETVWMDHPRPGDFTEMVMLCLRLQEEGFANQVLFTAGIIDFFVAALIFTRGRLTSLSLIYMSLWGLVTSLARPWSYYETSAPTESLKMWLPEMLYRAPHFAIPLCLLLALKQRCDNNASALPKHQDQEHETPSSDQPLNCLNGKQYTR